MRKFLISFDLNTSIDNGRTNDYSLVDNIIKKLGYCCKPLANTYLVATNSYDCKSIRDEVMKVLTAKDFILVVEIGTAFASFNYNDKNIEIRNLLSK